MARKSDGWADILQKVKRAADPETRPIDLFLETLEKAVLWTEAQEGWRSKHVHPSNLWRGVRWWYLYLTDTPRRQEDDPQSLRRMHNGIKAHERLDEYLGRVERVTDGRVRVDAIEHYFKVESLNFSGRIDAIITVMNQQYALEFKTAAANAFRAAQKNGPSSDYLWQAGGYTFATGLPVLFLYECKDNQEWFGCFPKAEAYALQVGPKLRAIQEAVTSRTVPPLCDVGCNTCVFQATCAALPVQGGADPRKTAETG
ncbi:MAG: hypothetical protein K6V97_06680 [Actinomycetia bacterium]|nr:hypothetical protein [Actinomycetes bacterium]